ncbi:MAG TPA: hypothetical protein VML91_14240 [Burkholderiales bacterium]|nr:hypothetical protein [Burkholderiales bacterium]
MSDGGDSGSLWLDASMDACVALHFAGSNVPERALGMDIGRVLDALGVDLGQWRSRSTHRRCGPAPSSKRDCSRTPRSG